MTDAPLIAILDDEPDIRRLLAAALEDAGFRTADILPPHGAFQKVGCKQMGAEICARIQ